MIKEIRNIENLFARVCFYIVGLIIMSLGIVTTYLAPKLGTGAFDALNYGMTETLGLTVGRWVLINGAIFILLNSLVERKFPKIHTVVTVMIIGHFIDFWLDRLAPFVTDQLMWQVIFLAVGLLILTIGAAAYIAADLIASPIDLLTLTMVKKSGKSFGLMKTIVEVACLLLALLFSGPIGVGTLVITVVIGPLIQVFLRPMNKLLVKFGKDKNVTDVMR